MSKKDDTKTIPILEDNRDATHISNNITISNYRELDREKDKDTIEKLIKEKQDALHNPYYSVDLNTNTVKQNERESFTISTNKTKDTILHQNNKSVYDLVLKDYIRLMDNFNKELDNYVDKVYTTIQDLENDIYKFNNIYDTSYYNGFNLKIKNYSDVKVREDYANKYADAIASIQLKEIKDNVDSIIEFLTVDLDSTKILKIIDIESLKDIQRDLKEEFAEQKENIDKDEVEHFLFKLMHIYTYARKLSAIEYDIEKNPTYYKKVKSLYKTIDDKILKIVGNFGNYYDKSNGIEIIENTPIVKRDNIKLPKTYTIDFDIMKLFNNIYPNYKFKSIDDDRHKDLDIKAKLMFDLDTNNPNNLEDMRLLEFIKNGNITLYPIQSALINGFIDVRDSQDTIDKVIPFLSTLKYITQDKKMRYPKSKKDIQLYEDFMLFFDRCKIQVRIVDRATNSVVFEVMQPIPLLSNTQAYSNSSGMGYIVGNSIINILKNELDNLHTTPLIYLNI